jgi:hypothetical protein
MESGFVQWFLNRERANRRERKSRAKADHQGIIVDRRMVVALLSMRFYPDSQNKSKGLGKILRLFTRMADSSTYLDNA